MKLIKLRNAAVIDAERILVVIRKDLNQYQIVLKQCPVAIECDLIDLEGLEQILNIEKLPQPPVIETKSGLEKGLDD